MGLPQLETCCFVFDLKTGNIIMGCVNAVMSFTLIVIMTVYSVMTDVERQEIEPLHDVEKSAGATGLYAMCVILTLMFTAKFCFDVVYIYGVITERPGIIKAYVIMWIVFFLLHMFIFFLNIVDFQFGLIFTESIYICINIYVILLIRSFYKQLNNREEV